MKFATPHHSWVQSLTALTATALIAGSPLLPKQAIASSPSNLFAQADAVDILVPPPEQNREGICPDMLDPLISTIVDSPAFASGRWGILVESLDSNARLYSRNPDQLLIPASNVKLFTTAAALQTLNTRPASDIAALTARIRTTNLDSNNGLADLLLRTIGGPTGARNLLSLLGINGNSYRQIDGSGLSRSNQASPAALITTLRVMRAANGNDVFYNSLPVAGVSGTLRNRFRGTPVQGRVRAKTGTLNGVRALSGYLEHADYGTLLFSIMVNQPGQSGDALVRSVDQVVLQLAKVVPCG